MRSTCGRRIRKNFMKWCKTKSNNAYYIYIYYIYIHSYVYIYMNEYRFSMTLWHKVTQNDPVIYFGKVHMSVQKRIYQGAGYTQDQTKGAILQELLDLQILKPTGRNWATAGRNWGSIRSSTGQIYGRAELCPVVYVRYIVGWCLMTSATKKSENIENSS